MRMRIRAVSWNSLVAGTLGAAEPSSELAKPSGAVRIAHLTDLHVGRSCSGRERDPEYVTRAWLAELRAAGVDVVAVSGDLVDYGSDEDALRAVHAMLEACGMGWAVVPGNHDIRSRWRPLLAKRFTEVFGAYPRVVTLSGVDFVLLDSASGGQHAFGLPLLSRALAGPTEGRVGEEQLAAVRLEARGGFPRVLVLHHHLQRRAADHLELLPFSVSESAFRTMKPLDDAAAVLAWARRAGVAVALFGHKHLMFAPGVSQEGVLLLNGGSSTELHGGAYRARLVDLQPSGDARIGLVQLAPE